MLVHMQMISNIHCERAPNVRLLPPQTQRCSDECLFGDFSRTSFQKALHNTNLRHIMLANYSCTFPSVALRSSQGRHQLLKFHQSPTIPLRPSAVPSHHVWYPLVNCQGWEPSRNNDSCRALSRSTSERRLVNEAALLRNLASMDCRLDASSAVTSCVK